jgi:hypothetical protein
MHSSHINNKRSLSSFTQDLEAFEDAYYILLDKSKEILIEYKKEGHNPRYHYKAQESFLSRERELAKLLLQIYRYFVDVNIMRVLFNYPVQTEDSEISQKRIIIFFEKIREIQLKVSEIMKGHLRIKSNYNEFAIQYYILVIKTAD